MSQKNLADTTIKNAKPKERDYTLNDGGGLIVYVKTNGTKQWVFRYTLEGKRKKTTFGSYPKITLAEARLKMDEFLRLLAEGKDPIEHNRALNEQKRQDEAKHKDPKTTIKHITDSYLELRRHNNGLQDITTSKAKRRLEIHVYKYLPQKQDTQINDLDYDLVVKILKKIENDERLETLGRVKNLIISVLKYAYSENLLDNAELVGKLEVKTFKAVRKDLVRNSPTITDPSDIKNLLLGIDDYSGEMYTKYALLLSIHTAQRQGSIISARWSDIDFSDKVWNIPARNMKMKIAHTIPLSTQVMTILDELKMFSGDREYLFPNTQYKSRHMSENTVNSALRRLGYSKDELVAHGLRSTFSTICNQEITTHNIPFDVIEQALAHKDPNKIRATYNRADYKDDLAKLMQWWSDYLDEVKNNVE